MLVCYDIKCLLGSEETWGFLGGGGSLPLHWQPLCGPQDPLVSLLLTP